MPDGASLTPETAAFIEVAGELSELYAGDLAMWTGSPFAWILTLPSRTKGAVGEKLVAEWLVRSGFKVLRSAHSGCDRVVNGANVEIKFSTLWKSGGYTFQQLRDQDYAHVFFLGLSPSSAMLGSFQSILLGLAQYRSMAAKRERTRGGFLSPLPRPLRGLKNLAERSTKRWL